MRDNHQKPVHQLHVDTAQLASGGNGDLSGSAEGQHEDSARRSPVTLLEDEETAALRITPTKQMHLKLLTHLGG